MDENINTTMVDDEQINDVEETEEYTSEESGSSHLGIGILIGGAAALGGIALGKKFGFKNPFTKEARIERHKKALDKLINSENADETVTTDAQVYVYDKKEK